MKGMENTELKFLLVLDGSDKSIQITKNQTRGLERGQMRKLSSKIISPCSGGNNSTYEGQEISQARDWKTARSSDLFECSEEVPVDVVVVNKANQVVALLNLL